jgi:hypothetical protein
MLELSVQADGSGSLPLLRSDSMVQVDAHPGSLHPFWALDGPARRKLISAFAAAVEGSQLADLPGAPTFIPVALAGDESKSNSQMGELFSAIDVDGSGSISHAELAASMVNSPGQLRGLLLPSVGHQLLPSQNSQWVYRYALLYLLLEAAFVPFLWRFLGLASIVRLRDRVLVVEEGEGRVPRISTIVLATPSSDTSYNAGQHVIAVFRVRALVGMCCAVVINMLAWAGVLGESFLPQEAARNSTYLLRWALDLIVLLVRSMSEQRPSYMGFALVMLFVSIIATMAFALRVLEKLPIVLPYSGTGEGDLPAVMPLLLDVKNTPFAMVSYAWGTDDSSTTDKAMPSLARALAAALPNCWSDVHMLSSGSVIPSVTSHVARTAHLLVLVITPSYLRSRNCAIELVAALLHRRAHHVTWAYVSPEVPHSVCHFLSQHLGVRLFSCARQLLEEAGNTVYRTPDDAAVTRLTRWFAVYGEARESVSRNFRLPPPRVRDGWFCACSGRLLRPRGSVTAGRFFLAPDATAFGTSVVIVPEQVLLALMAGSLAATFALLRAGYLANAPIGDTLPQDVPLSLWLPLPAILGVVLALIVAVLLPFALHADVRTHHSSLLLPLCASAYIQTYDGAPVAAVPAPLLQRQLSLRSGGAAAGGSRGATSGAISFLFAVGDAQLGMASDPLLEQRLENVLGFMRELGLQAQRAPYGEGKEAPALLSDPAALCVCVFVLRSQRDAVHWLRTHCATFALSNTILLVEGSVARARVRHGERWLNDYVYLDVSRMGRSGPEGCGAYAGFAPMLLDHIGAKIGSSYLSALRKCIQTQ